MKVARASSPAVALFVIAAGLTLGEPSPARAAASCSAAVAQDFDDDRRADLVVARTLPSSRAGVVDLVMSGGRTQTIDAAALGFTSTANDQFGAAVQIASIDELDNCPDLIIGAPGGGAVYVVRGNGFRGSRRGRRLGP